MIKIFEDIFKNQDNEKEVDGIIDLTNEEWNTGIKEPKNDTWSTGRDDSVWTVG